MELKNLLTNLSQEETNEINGGYQGGIGPAQCAWIAVSCVNYLPGVGWGCGGQQMCEIFKKYCNEN